jgi:hypothetical protein
MAQKEGFKRINFFRGFLTTEDDWNFAEQYHVEKKKIHNRLLHAPGVVPNFLGGLRVTARGRGDMSVEIAPGYAIDGNGNDIYLTEPEIKTVNPMDYKLPQTLYIVAKYYEELTDYVAYKENPEYKGHKRVAEKVKIDVIITEPEVSQEVELARVYLEKGVKKISDAKIPFDPKANEIDMRFVPLAGIAGSNLPPKITRELLELLMMNRDVFAYFGHRLKITPALDVLHAIHTFYMLIYAGYVDMRNVFNLFQLLFDTEWDMIADIEANFPDISSRKDFADYKKNLGLIKGMYLEHKFSLEFLTSVFEYQRKGIDSVRGLFAKELTPKKAIKKEAKVPAEALWEKIKVRSEDFGTTLILEGMEFKRIDMIDVLDAQSEQKHRLIIKDERDKYRSRQKQKYPDGTIIEDVGVHFEGGYAEWEFSNVEPGKGLVVITRMDYVRGEYECEVFVNGKRASNLVCPGNDMKFRWRNWPYLIPGEFVNEAVIRIKLVPITADRDVNMFKIWAYQPV